MPQTLTKLERGILNVLSLVCGIGLALIVKTIVWRTGIGPIWTRALVVGGTAFAAYLAFDWYLFRSAIKNLPKS